MTKTDTLRKVTIHLVRDAKSLRLVLFILILLGGPYTSTLVRAQASTPRFIHLTGEQGLSHNVVQCILQDSQGFMWFGTDLRSFLQIKIIVLDNDGEEQLALEAFREGALGHLVKRKAQPAEIVAAIRAVVRGRAILSPGVAGRILDTFVQERHRKADNRASTETDP